MRKDGACAALGLALVATWSAALSAAPVPGRDGAKPYAFAPGRFVLTGDKEPARGGEVKDLMEDFYLRPGQFILSGGPNATDAVTVDDDLEVRAGDKVLFEDNDHIRSSENRGKAPARYQGHPIVLVVEGSGKLRVRATDCAATSAVVGELWLHRHDGAKRKLTGGATLESGANLPNVFFDEEYDLADGFEKPATVRQPKGPAVELPTHPAALLRQKAR